MLAMGRTMSIQIRRVVSEEWENWKMIRLDSLKQHPESFGSSYEDEAALSDDDFRRRISNNTLWGAWLNNQMVGTVGFFVMKGEKVCHRGCMFGMYLQNEARGSGAAGGLVQTLLEYARSHVAQVHCTVITENEPAIKLYKRHEFKIYGTEPRSLHVNDRYYDEHMMVHSFS